MSWGAGSLGKLVLVLQLVGELAFEDVTLCLLLQAQLVRTVEVDEVVPQVRH